MLAIKGIYDGAIGSPKDPELYSEIKSLTANHGLKIDVKTSSLAKK